jgi:hypothetical protein
MKIIKKTFHHPCACKILNPISVKGMKRKGRCILCNGKGKIKDTLYYHVITGKDGKQHAFEGETIK